MHETSNRKQQLIEARNLIENATFEEKYELFQDIITPLEALQEELSKPESEFYPYRDIVWQASDFLYLGCKKLMTNRIGWVDEAIALHCSRKGRSPAYSNDQKIEICALIFLLVKRGASKQQAVKLATRLHGDVAMSGWRNIDSFYKSFQKEHELYKALTATKNLQEELQLVAYIVPSFLKFTVAPQNLISDEASSQNAAKAFTKLWEDILSYMRESHPLIREKDKAYPEIFGSVINWINSEYDEAIDAFYRHPSHAKIEFETRRREFFHFLQSALFYNKQLQTS